MGVAKRTQYGSRLNRIQSEQRLMGREPSAATEIQKTKGGLVSRYIYPDMQIIYVLYLL